MQTMLLESSFLLAVQTPGLSCEAPTRGVEMPSLPTKYRTVIFRQKKQNHTCTLIQMKVRKTSVLSFRNDFG